MPCFVSSSFSYSTDATFSSLLYLQCSSGSHRFVLEVQNESQLFLRLSFSTMFVFLPAVSFCPSPGLTADVRPDECDLQKQSSYLCHHLHHPEITRTLLPTSSCEILWKHSPTSLHFPSAHSSLMFVFVVTSVGKSSSRMFPAPRIFSCVVTLSHSRAFTQISLIEGGFKSSEWVLF